VSQLFRFDWVWRFAVSIPRRFRRVNHARRTPILKASLYPKTPEKTSRTQAFLKQIFYQELWGLEGMNQKGLC
jgi:hypothetical protein